MYYLKKESYNFRIPKEYKAYLNFKEKLRNSGITFLEEGGNTRQTVIIDTRGYFDVDDNGDILKLIKEEQL